jgi:tRNA-Thr(GGU) m(6)t(6)A37 methyltransferase TsaA
VSAANGPVFGIDLSGPANTRDTAVACFERGRGRLVLRESLLGADDREIHHLVARYAGDTEVEVVVGIDAPLGGARRAAPSPVRFRLLEHGGEMNLEPIGTVRSPVSRTDLDENWGAVVSEIHLVEPLAAGLQGLDQFSHLIVVFLMDHTFDRGKDLVRRPRGRADMPECGIFAQRAKHRPNPIGVTPVRLLGTAGNVVTVRGLDAIDGTPVLDLKPYFPVFDQVPEAVVPEWVDRLMVGYFTPPTDRPADPATRPRPRSRP